MANRFTTAVSFAFEKNLTLVAAQMTYNSGGLQNFNTPALVPLYSKGLCSVNNYTPTFTGNTTGSSATITSVTSFQGLYVGQSVTGLGIIGSTTTISSISASAGTLTLSSGTNVTSVSGGTLAASGGQLILQFGTQAGVRLDSYNKLMYSGFEFRESGSTAVGTSNRQALYPGVSDYFIIQNNTAIRTIPQTLTTASTDCSIIVQFGIITAPNVFVAANPQAGEQVNAFFMFSNSSAI